MSMAETSLIFADTPVPKSCSLSTGTGAAVLRSTASVGPSCGFPVVVTAGAGFESGPDESGLPDGLALSLGFAPPVEVAVGAADEPPVEDGLVGGFSVSLAEPEVGAAGVVTEVVCGLSASVLSSEPQELKVKHAAADMATIATERILKLNVAP